MEMEKTLFPKVGTKNSDVTEYGIRRVCLTVCLCDCHGHGQTGLHWTDINEILH
jgi:hypothetical protein